jgi:hypothetical protein
MSQREEDLRMLRQVTDNIDEIGSLDQDDEDSYQATMYMAFKGMIQSLTDGDQRQLSDKQRQWVKREADKVAPEYENLVSLGKVPRGREVPTLPVLDPLKLPKRPPPRRST